MQSESYVKASAVLLMCNQELKVVQVNETCARLVLYRTINSYKLLELVPYNYVISLIRANRVDPNPNNYKIYYPKPDPIKISG